MRLARAQCTGAASCRTGLRELRVDSYLLAAVRNSRSGRCKEELEQVQGQGGLRGLPLLGHVLKHLPRHMHDKQVLQHVPGHVSRHVFK